METVWEGKITPNYELVIQHWGYSLSAIHFNKVGEIDRFNIGINCGIISVERSKSLLELTKLAEGTHSNRDSTS